MPGTRRASRQDHRAEGPRSRRVVLYLPAGVTVQQERLCAPPPLSLDLAGPPSSCPSRAGATEVAHAGRPLLSGHAAVQTGRVSKLGQCVEGVGQAPPFVFRTDAIPQARSRGRGSRLPPAPRLAGWMCPASGSSRLRGCTRAGRHVHMGPQHRVPPPPGLVGVARCWAWPAWDPMPAGPGATDIFPAAPEASSVTTGCGAAAPPTRPSRWCQVLTAP